jgi:hypothetical protein
MRHRLSPRPVRLIRRAIFSDEGSVLAVGGGTPACACRSTMLRKPTRFRVAPSWDRFAPKFASRPRGARAGSRGCCGSYVRGRWPGYRVGGVAWLERYQAESATC